MSDIEGFADVEHAVSSLGLASRLYSTCKIVKKTNVSAFTLGHSESELEVKFGASDSGFGVVIATADERTAGLYSHEAGLQF
jgi:hypothetical protein